MDSIRTIFAQYLGKIWTISRQIHTLFGQCVNSNEFFMIINKYFATELIAFEYFFVLNVVVIVESGGGVRVQFNTTETLFKSLLWVGGLKWV